MNYEIYFETKLENMDKWVRVGEDWISIPNGCSTLIREVCGAYPSDWDGAKCSEIFPVLMQGASLLNLNPARYKPLEGASSWCSVRSTCDILMKIADVCDKYPTAVIVVIT